MGKTVKTEEEITKIVDEMGSKEFRGKDYHLIRKNCNHFSNVFCKVRIPRIKDQSYHNFDYTENLWKRNPPMG